MTALYRLLQLQQQGFSEPEIVNTLQQEGFSMKDINDSMNQAKIKSAVSQDPEQNLGGSPSSQEGRSYEEASQIGSSQLQSDMSGSQFQQPSPPQEYQQYQDYQSPQGYGGYYQDAGMGSTQTVTDVVEQIVIGKTQDIVKKINDLNQSRNKLQRDVDELKDRLKRIESSLDHIQKAIIGKIGEFGESTRMVQRDLENIHGTMSKMMNPLMDNYNELKRLNSREFQNRT